MRLKATLISFLSILLIIGISLSFESCKKGDEAEGIDKEMFDMAQSYTGYTWYKNSGDLLPKSSGSGHNFTYLRTRYNEIASTMLDTDGKIIDSASFPEGSFIVKELMNDANTIERYAMLYKQSGSSSSDANGWVWGYIDSDGTVAEPADKRGSSCIGCHSQEGNIDYMLMNKFFP
jgi:hypothetical protein